MAHSKVTLLGLGLMGFELAAHLLKGGYSVTVWNRTISKADGLKEIGGHLTVASSGKEAAKASPVVISVLFAASNFHEILDSLDSEDYKGRTFISVSTIAPEDSLAFYKKVTSHGGEYIETPVLGNSAVAHNATLQVMVGGTKEQYDKFHKMLSVWGIVRYVGDVGSAAKVKLALNSNLASALATYTSSRAFLEKSGVDTDIFETILSNSPFATAYPYFNIWHGKIKNQQYDDVAFTLAGMHKDIKLMLEQSKQVGIDTAQIEGTYKLYEHALANFDHSKDFSIVYEQVKKEK